MDFLHNFNFILSLCSLISFTTQCWVIFVNWDFICGVPSFVWACFLLTPELWSRTASWVLAYIPSYKKCRRFGQYFPKRLRKTSKVPICLNLVNWGISFKSLLSKMTDFSVLYAGESMSNHLYQNVHNQTVHDVHRKYTLPLRPSNYVRLVWYITLGMVGLDFSLRILFPSSFEMICLLMNR